MLAVFFQGLGFGVTLFFELEGLPGSWRPESLAVLFPSVPEDVFNSIRSSVLSPKLRKPCNRGLLPSVERCTPYLGPQDLQTNRGLGYMLHVFCGAADSEPCPEGAYVALTEPLCKLLQNHSGLFCTLQNPAEAQHPRKNPLFRVHCSTRKDSIRASCDYDGDSNASGRVVTTVPTFSSFFFCCRLIP